MSTLYDRIVMGCKEHGCTPGRMCDDLSYRRGFMSELKNANTKYLSCEKIANIAGYLGMSCDFLLTGQEYNGFTMAERNLLHAFKTAPLDTQETIRFMLRNYMPVSSEKQDVRLA